MSAATETLRRRIAAESPGFYDTFDALTDPEHPNHADAKEWPTTTILTSSTNCQSNTRSPASQTAETPRLIKTTQPKADS
ncbi:hypothetical protein [Mesorhizobium sp.]|uniref:hypothetical protein n=1 Tax=Mesorhizobium sp. TaxID=1871066 RepID=UPI0025EC276D|nr:hypothetical protein [Mesorhizobium sp.]